jgi:acetate kinase
MNKTILTVNSGSSTLKASFFAADGTRRDFYYGHVRRHQDAFDQLMHDLGGDTPAIVGHRFVHGGEISEPARLVDDNERIRLEGLVHLAPLHMPGNLLGVDMCLQRFPVPQLACFDTAFHATMPELAKRFPIPSELGLRRFGFHGLSYAYIATRLPELLGAAARGTVVVAHLGSGSSLCLMQDLKSVDTTMGYTPAGGVAMGTRSGDLDPGVMLELSRRFDHKALSDMVYHKMGLLALSEGESPEMRVLASSPSEAAKFAVAYYCRQVRAAIGSLAAKAGGIDALVFSGGIGEHASEVRAEICAALGFMNLKLDAAANQTHALRIEAPDSKPILIVPTDEEGMIRDLCQKNF